MYIRGGILYLCFLLIPLTAPAQPGQAPKTFEQFKKETKSLKDDTNKVLRYLEFAKTVGPPDTAVAVISFAITLSDKLNYQRGSKLGIYLHDQNIYTAFKSKAKNLKEDTNKVLLYVRFANSLQESRQFWDSAGVIVIKAKELSYRLNYQRGIELSIYAEGFRAEVNKEFPLAIRYYTQAEKIAESHRSFADIYGKYPEIYQIYNACLNIYYYQADYPGAMDIAQKGLSLAGQLNNKEDQAHYDNQIGFIYQKQEKADESIKYYTQYLRLANEINNTMMVADACNGIADGYLLKKSYKTSLFYFLKALNIYNNMTGDFQHDGERFEKTRSVFKHERVAYTLFKISTAYKQAGNYKQALHYSLAVIDKINKTIRLYNKYDLAGYYINAGDIYRLLKDYRQANAFLNKGLSLAKSIHHHEDIRDAFEALSKNFAAQKRYDSAYVYHVLFTGLKDSIINEKISREINTLELERRDKEITVLNQQQKLKATEAARQNITRNFIIGFVALIAVILILLIYIQSRIKQQKLVFEKQLAIQTERQRISSDMHDDIGTGLSTMLIYVNMLKSKLSDKPEYPDIERVSALGNELVVQMKEIVWSLNPGNDSLESLLVFIRQYFVQLFEPLPYHAGLIFPVSIPVVGLKGAVRRNIFLCVKEALNNVIKHAGANRVELNVQVHHGKLMISIKDNGAGFPANSGSKFFSNGLKNMQRRMDQVNGKFRFFNEGGAVISIELELTGYPNG